MDKNNHRFVIDTNLISSANEHGLSLSEFILITYFDNAFNPVFDIELISIYTKLKEEDIMMAFSTLVEKKIIEIEITKDKSNKVVEKINLDSFYKKVRKEQIKKEESKKSNDIFSTFENEFGRTLSPMDYEVIKAWIEKGFTEELIIAALKEATYNGVSNLRYIDKVLYEWNKKNITTVEDINKRNKESNSLEETKILNFNWLDND